MYNQIRQLYTEPEFIDFNNQLGKSLLVIQRPSFEGFPEVFENFYRQLKQLISGFLMNNYFGFDAANKIRHKIIKDNFPKDLALVIIKYDYMFYGFNEQWIDVYNIMMLKILDNNAILISNTNRTLFLYDESPNIYVFTFEDTITEMLVLSKETVLLGTDTGRLIVWNYKTKMTEKELEKHPKHIVDMKLLMDGTILTLPDSNKNLRIWTGDNYQEVDNKEAFGTLTILKDTIILWDIERNIWDIYDFTQHQYVSIDDNVVDILAFSQGYVVITNKNINIFKGQDRIIIENTFIH